MANKSKRWRNRRSHKMQLFPALMKCKIFPGLWLYISVFLTGCAIQKENSNSTSNLLNVALRSAKVKYNSYPMAYPISGMLRDPEFGWWMLRDDEKSLRNIARIIKKFTLRDIDICIVDKRNETRDYVRIQWKKEVIEELNSLLHTIQFNPGTNFRSVWGTDFGEYAPVYFWMESVKGAVLVIPLNAITNDTGVSSEKCPFYTPHVDRMREILIEAIN